MTLVVDLFDAAEGPYSYLNAIENDAAGFESYRKDLWGSQSLISRGAKFFPQLVDGDLWVFPDDLNAFRNECAMVHDAAVYIADELWDKPQQAEHIRNYITTFYGAIDLAIERNAGVCIS